MNTQINTGALAVLATIGQWTGSITKVAEAIAAPTNGLTKDEQAENKQRQATVAQAVRGFAEETEAKGVKPEDAGVILREGLRLMGFPEGTALNYGRAVQGFRAIKATTGKWDGSVRDAQRAMRSDDTKAKDDIREALRPMLRDATLEQLKAVQEYAQNLGIVVKDRAKRSDTVQQTATPAAAEPAAPMARAA